MSNPVLAEVTRGGIVESQHRGSVAVVDSDGKLLYSLGDIERLHFPRSAMKPFQALATLESGAADAFALTEAEIALHCSSHNGEPEHVERVSGWLKKIDLDESSLGCGCQVPFFIMHNLSRVKESPEPSALCNNCSGKHAGFLTAARHLQASLQDYLSPAHPVHQNIIRLLSEMSDFPVDKFTLGVDGCSAPVFALPIRQFALALARLANPAELSPPRARAARQVIAAMRKYPWLVAGTDRIDTLLMQEKAFTGIAKCGAEGYYAMALPDQGLGVAIKIDDGGDRAAGVVATAVLNHLAVGNGPWSDGFRRIAEPEIKNWKGTVVGHIRAVV